jgi:hypothetical protein
MHRELLPQINPGEIQRVRDGRTQLQKWSKIADVSGAYANTPNAAIRSKLLITALSDALLRKCSLSNTTLKTALRAVQNALSSLPAGTSELM